MSWLLVIAIAYATGCLIAFFTGMFLMQTGKDDAKLEARLFHPDERDLLKYQRRIQLGLSLIKGGCIAWPKIAVLSIKRSIREAERMSR